MKTIYLFRHAEPLRLADIHQEEWPLSPKGHDMAEALKTLNGAARVYASPLLRAVQTAQHAGLPLTVDPRLQERKTGNATPDMGDCWLRQYEDGTFKCPDGESFDEVGQRMQACLEEILAALGDGQAAIVVSHAAAICAYLKRFCTIRVTDRPSKKGQSFGRKERSMPGICLPWRGLPCASGRERWSALKHCHHERSNQCGYGTHQILHRRLPGLPFHRQAIHTQRQLEWQLRPQVGRVVGK